MNRNFILISQATPAVQIYRELEWQAWLKATIVPKMGTQNIPLINAVQNP